MRVYVYTIPFMCFLSIGWDQNYSMGSCANINDVLSSLLPFCARTSITSVSLKKRSNFRNHHDILGLSRVPACTMEKTQSVYCNRLIQHTIIGCPVQERFKETDAFKRALNNRKNETIFFGIFFFPRARDQS